jgi:hypothetical protein
VWAGDSSGLVEALDLRAARLAGGLKGLTGGVRALACHPTLPVLAAVSLNRFLRLYDTQARSPRARGGVGYRNPNPT